MSAVTRLFNQARKWQYEIHEIGAKVQKLNAEELEDFITAIKDEISLCVENAKKYQEDLEKGKIKQAKLRVKYEAITAELDKLPPQAPEYDVQGRGIARGHHYYKNEHTLNEKDFSVLKRYTKGEETLFRLKHRIGHYISLEERLKEILRIAEGGEFESPKKPSVESSRAESLGVGGDFMDQFRNLTGSNIFGAKK